MPDMRIALEVFLLGISGTFVGMIVLYISMRLLSVVAGIFSEEEKK